MMPMEIRPTYTVPLLVIGLIVFFVTLFGGIFGMLPFVIEDAPFVLKIGSGAGVIVVFLSWFGLFRAWTTRRKFAYYLLKIETGSVSPGTLTRFVIEDRGSDLNVAASPRFSLSYQDVFHRKGGRKVYTEGPFLLDVKVRSELSANGVYPSMTGEFTVNADEIKTQPPDDDWENQTLVLLTLRLPGGRQCKFELPYAPAPLHR